MMQPRSKWRGALWIFSIIAVLYAYSVSNAFFATELGYVYDPTTDRLFELNLTLNISTCDKWTELSARDPNDLAEMRYNRALALFSAGRDEEATSALRAALAVAPKVIKTLLSEKPKPVKSESWGVRVGGAEEAWLYRQAHLALWQRYNALDWAKKVASRKTRVGETSRIG